MQYHVLYADDEIDREEYIKQIFMNIAVIVFVEKIAGKLEIVIVNSMLHPPLFQHPGHGFTQELGYNPGKSISYLAPDVLFHFGGHQRPGIHKGSLFPKKSSHLFFPIVNVTFFKPGIFCLPQVIVQEIPRFTEQPFTLPHQKSRSKKTAFAKEITRFGIKQKPSEEINDDQPKGYIPNYEE
jgi:hypothetical protein